MIDGKFHILFSTKVGKKECYSKRIQACNRLDFSIIMLLRYDKVCLIGRDGVGAGVLAEADGAVGVDAEDVGRFAGGDGRTAAPQDVAARGMVSMTLNVGSVNSSAVRLYESMGYKSQSIVMRRFLK